MKPNFSFPGRYWLLAASVVLSNFLGAHEKMVAADAAAHGASELHDAAIAELQNALIMQAEFIKVHAAEALLGSDHSNNVQAVFEKLLEQHSETPKFRLGIWRVLSRATSDQSDRDRYLAKLRDACLVPNGPECVHGAESLAKLGYRIHQADRSRFADATQAANEVGNVYFRWLLVVSGTDQDLESLADLLNSPNFEVRTHAAYGLRHLTDKLTPAIREKLAKAASNEPESARRVYLVSAAYITASDQHQAQHFKALLLPYAKTGGNVERYEVAAALALRGTSDDYKLLAELLKDPDADVKVSAANAILRIERRLEMSMDVRREALSEYFPPPESEGGWRTSLPQNGLPDASQKKKILDLAGVDWDKLAKAWEFNAAVEGATQLLVIRRGYIVGEWSRGCDHRKAFNIYSSSKSYTSVAWGLLLKDSEENKLPGGNQLTLDTKICNEKWLPESLPLPDARKADITIRQLLNMASGLDAGSPPDEAPFEWSLGKLDGSPMMKLKDDPGTAFHYSNAGVAHLVMVFNRAAGRDLLPFLKERVLDPIGQRVDSWLQIGGNGKIGPHDQGYSGLRCCAREHARFCHLALHRGKWAGREIIPASYFDFAWQGQKIEPKYGAQWWVYPRHPIAPKDLVQTAGAKNNNGYLVPSLDLVFVRLGDGDQFPKDWEQEFVKRVVDAVVK